jgi:hypothetical protein
MGTQDGSVTGTFYIFPDPINPGPGLPPSNIGPQLPAGGGNSGLVEIVLLAEGFTSAETPLFVDKCISFTNWLQKVPWFDVFGQALRIGAIQVASNQSGMDDFRDGGNLTRATYFDCAMGDWWQSDPNMISYNSGLAADLCNQHFPTMRAAIILVNSRQGRANASSPFAVVPVRTQDDEDGVPVDTSGAGDERWMDTILHELGHSLFGLADEYNYWLGCGKDEDRNQVGWGFEPFEPNVTRELNVSNVKWRHLIKPGAPTAQWDDCEDCPSYDNPFAANADFANDSVSLFEGAKNYHCGLFRPAFRCRMRNGAEFCLVCLEAIYQELRPLLPAAAVISTEPKVLPTLQACVGVDDSQVHHFRIANLGSSVVAVRLEADQEPIQLTPVGATTLLPGQFLDCTAKLSLQTALIPETTALITVLNDGDKSMLATIPVPIAVCAPDIRRTLAGGVRFNRNTNRWELDFGRIVTNHTSYQEVQIINLQACCSQQLEATVSIPSSSGTFLTIPAAQVNPVSLPAAPRGGPDPSGSVWIAFTADPSLPTGNVPGALAVSISYTTGGTDTITVLAQVVPQISIDAMLAVDRSGSMGVQTVSNGPSRMEAVIDAIDQFVNFLQDGDQIGLVRFNQSALQNPDLLVDLNTAGPGGARQAVLDALDPTDPDLLLPSGSTSLGNGGFLAAAVLIGKGVAQRRAVIMLTDGEGNMPPSARQAVLMASNANPAQRFYIIAFEAEKMSDELAEVSNMPPRLNTNGNVIGPAAQILVTGTLAAEREFILHKFYTQILADQTGQAFVVDPVYTLAPGQSTLLPIGFGEVDYAADIVVCARPSIKYLGMSLISPTGTTYEFDLNNTAVNTGTMQKTLSEKGKWKAFRCTFPIKPDENHVGEWQLMVHNHADDADLRFTVLVTADSDLLLDGWVQQEAHRPGLPMDITLKPTLFGRAVALQEPVEVLMTRPGGGSELLKLDQKTDGTYGGRYRKTDQVGDYQCTAVVTAPSPMGMKLTRERHLTGFIAQPMPKKGKFPKKPAQKPHKHWKTVSIKEFLRSMRQRTKSE